jgi:hypothetical protein
MRLVALQSVMNIEVVGSSGYLLPPRACGFQQLGGLSSMPSPVPLRVRVHPLVSFASPTEYVLLCHPSDPNAEALAPNTSQGFVPIRDTSSWSLPFDELPKAHLCFALSVSHALGDFLLQIPRGLVSSHSHVRDSLFRGFPRCQAGSSHRRVVPSCRWWNSPTSELPHWIQILPLRLQGVDPGSDPLWMTGGLDLPTLDPLLGFQLPWAFVQTPWRRLHVPSAHDLSCCALAVYSAAGLQRINRYPA